MDTDNLLNDMKTTILDLIGDLKENIFILSDEQGDLILVEFFFKKIHPDRVIQHIIDHVLPWKDKIKKRDINFFIENQGIFQGLPDDRIFHYGEVIGRSDRVDDEDRRVIWEYFDTMIILSEEYKKNK